MAITITFELVKGGDVIAAGAFNGLLPSPILAGAAMSLSSVSVTSNARRLRKMRLCFRCEP